MLSSNDRGVEVVALLRSTGEAGSTATTTRLPRPGMRGWSRRTRASCRVRPQLEEVIAHGDNVVVAVRTPMSRHDLRARPINNHNPERFLDVPEPVVGADHELRCLVGDVGDAALDPGQVAGFGSSTRFTDLSAPVITMNRLRFTGTFPADRVLGLGDLLVDAPQRAAGPVGLVRWAAGEVPAGAGPFPRGLPPNRTCPFPASGSPVTTP